MTNGKKNIQKDKKTEEHTNKQRVERDHRVRISASLYTIIKKQNWRDLLIGGKSMDIAP